VRRVSLVFAARGGYRKANFNFENRLRRASAMDLERLWREYRLAASTLWRLVCGSQHICHGHVHDMEEQRGFAWLTRCLGIRSNSSAAALVHGLHR
jgi:hypothetical protein